MALPLYAITLFVSAFILFLVQPIIGKIILPKLGGTPQVWNTCMVFFQSVLLLGYAYTHNVSTRLTLRQQLLCHGGLLLLPLIVLLPLPFALGGADSAYSIWQFVPDLGSNPIPTTLKTLFMYVALPFGVVATTAPLLQKWFAYTGHPAAKDPYFLYGASNFGSMLSLIVYPILVEPMVSLRHQSWMYAGGYLCLIVLVVACASMVWNVKETTHTSEPHPKPPLETPPAPLPAEAQAGITADAPAPVTGVKSGQPGRQPARPAARPHLGTEPSIVVPDDTMTFGRRFRWVMLAAVPSSMMLGITTHITTDLSPIPLFWLIPLILYLFSFILVFARWPVVWVEEPHTYMVYAQPFCILFMIMAYVMHLTSSPTYIGMAIIAQVLGFFTTTMVCHGELAKDRPGTKHLTEFYLWMSVGGMVGGIFNALIAPVLFKKLWEFPLAIFAACLVRPKMFEAGILDNWLANLLEGQAADKPAAVPTKPGQKHHPKTHQPQVQIGGASESLIKTLDWVWPVIIFVTAAALVLIVLNPREARTGMIATCFGIPLLLCCLCMARPMRIGLGIGAVLLVNFFYQSRSDGSVYSSRSYFGTISVTKGGFSKDGIDFYYHQLVHGTTLHGQNFFVPKDDRGNPKKDWSRLATTYYHREGPVGRVMEKFNWFPGPPNTYWADARLPAALFTSLFLDLGTATTLPLTTLVSAWSEPPYATVGLGTGTMASYNRPYQHVHFYEIDNQIFRLSLVTPTRDIDNFQQYDKIRTETHKSTYFNYLERAVERGGTVQVLMGDARLRMNLPYMNHYLDKTDHGGGPEQFYHMMVVDAFSSDAIPAHLLTKQAVKMYFGKLTEEGILCVHTSNKFADLVKVVVAIANDPDLKLAYLRGHDSNEDRENGHTTSEWVMLARKDVYLEHLRSDREFLDRYAAAMDLKKQSGTYWDQPSSDARYLWTDDYYNLLSVVRFLK